MAKWNNTVDVSDLYAAYERDQDFQKLAGAVIERLKATELFDDVIVQQLEDAKDVNDIEEWDLAWNDLYDFCDVKRIWIKILA